MANICNYCISWFSNNIKILATKTIFGFSSVLLQSSVPGLPVICDSQQQITQLPINVTDDFDTQSFNQFWDTEFKSSFLIEKLDQASTDYVAIGNGPPLKRLTPYNSIVRGQLFFEFEAKLGLVEDEFPTKVVLLKEEDDSIIAELGFENNQIYWTFNNVTQTIPFPFVALASWRGRIEKKDNIIKAYYLTNQNWIQFTNFGVENTDVFYIAVQSQNAEEIWDMLIPFDETGM